VSATETPLKRVAYYKGCLASLSAKELDSSTKALAPMVGLELVELESVTCCGAGDIHEAEPDYYLHLNARILAYAEATGCEMLMTVCNVCTLNLRQANFMLQGDAELLARVNENLETVGVPAYSGKVEVRHFLWEIAEGEGYERLKEVAHRGLKGLKVAPFYGCQILRPSKIMGFEDPDRLVKMNGREVYKFATRVLVSSAEAVLRQCGESVEDVDVYVPHQANVRIIDHATKKLGIPSERVVINVDRYGNTSSGSIPLALADAQADGRLQAGSLVLMTGMGAGLTWGSALMRWTLEAAA